MKTILGFFILCIGSVQAGFTTVSRDLQSRNHVPLENCSIFQNSRDRETCSYLKRGLNPNWESEGYAVSCDLVSENKRSACHDLANDLAGSASDMIECISSNVDEREKCEIVKKAYARGQFENFTPVKNEIITRSTYVTSSGVVTETRTCDMAMYDRAVENWRMRKEEQLEKGKTKAAIGTVAAIGGVLLGLSSDRGVRAIGTGLAVGGTLVAAWGLVEMADADSQMPHLNPYCKSEWVAEPRVVIVERQQCTSIRYSQRNGYSSRYYYEVQCSSRRYVTYDDFRPWHEGRVYQVRY